MKVAVIGAGPTGLSAALRVLQIDPSVVVDVYETSFAVGGLSRSFRLFDHIVDLGPHRFFTQNQKIMNFWLELAQQDFHRVDRKTRVLYDGQWISYPLQVIDLLKVLPLHTKIKILKSFLKRSQHEKFDGHNFSSTMRYRFGDELYEMFFKDYTERLWGVSGTQLSADLAYQRIGEFGLRQAIKHAFKSTFSDVGDFFFYPSQGCGQIWSSAMDRINNGVSAVHLSTPVTAIEPQTDGGTIVHSSLGQKEYDHVISTIPLSQLISVYTDVPAAIVERAKNLRFRSTVLVYVEVLEEPHFIDQWIYIHCSNIHAGRITNFANWGIPDNKTNHRHTLCLEYWCSVGDSFWMMEDELLQDLARNDLLALDYNPDKLHRMHVVKLPNTYPVITHESEAILDEISIYMKTKSRLQTIGRGGAFKYNNQDHCMEMGFLAAENIYGQKNNTWDVNGKKMYLEKDLIQVRLPPG